jgi:hypothetical protein
MGWLKKRLGEQNTALGLLLVYVAMRSKFPEHAPIIDMIGGVLGVGHVVVPQGAGRDA